MNFATEVETLIRARYPILYVISSEELRVQQVVTDIARKRQKKLFEWSYSTGIVPAGPDLSGWLTPHGRESLGGRPFGDGTPPGPPIPAEVVPAANGAGG